MAKTFIIQVRTGDGIPESDTQYLVVVIVEVNGIKLGQVRLAGGDLATAKGIAHSLKNMSDAGTDITEFLPPPQRMEPGEPS